MFLDHVSIHVTAGDGGAGCMSFRREAYVPKGGPNGGDGAPGGNIVVVAEPGISSLLDYRFKHHFKAERGTHGKGSGMHGARGKDTRLRVPLGTVVRDSDTGKFLGDLTVAGQELIVAQGGAGGRGNPHFVTSVRRAPAFAELGEPGEEVNLEFELKLLADVALVGMPSVGKSSIIARLSAARPKIADYPFTTLVPNLGVVSAGGRSFVLADIPGLIEGAAQGKGLGLSFLRHIERSALILHVVDLSGGWEDRDPVEDYFAIESELKEYDEELAERPHIIVGNKIDTEGAKERSAAMRELAESLDIAYFEVSAVTGEGLDAMTKFTAERVYELRMAAQAALELEESEKHYEKVYTHKRSRKEEPKFDVVNMGGGVWRIVGREIERMIIQTDFENDEAVAHLQGRLNRAGIERELLKSGARPGDEVRILGHNFNFDPDSMED